LFVVCSNDEKYKLTRQLGSHSGAAVVGAGLAPGGVGVVVVGAAVVIVEGTAEVTFSAAGTAVDVELGSAVVDGGGAGATVVCPTLQATRIQNIPTSKMGLSIISYKKNYLACPLCMICRRNDRTDHIHSSFHHHTLTDTTRNRDS
jgi:hypothetical protein